MRFCLGTLVALLIGGWGTATAETAWEKHEIKSPAKGMINSALAHDWDEDGHIDVLSTYDGNAVLLKGPDWKPHPVFAFRPGLARNKLRAACIHSCLMDVDGDGDPDFIGSSNTVLPS